jgi:hypothetical protein
VVEYGARDRVKELGARGGVVDGGEGVEVSVVRALGDLSTAMEIGDAFAKGTPVELAIGIAGGWAQDLEVARLGEGGLDAQDAAGLVVHLDGVAPEPVLDAYSLGTVLEARR